MPRKPKQQPFVPTRDWKQPQTLGAGSLHYAPDPAGGFWVILDGVRRVHARNEAGAVFRCERLYEALRPEQTCPACGKYVAVIRHPNGSRQIGRHLQPALHADQKRRCPASNLKLGPEP